jgi:hypothetical protein
MVKRHWNVLFDVPQNNGGSGDVGRCWHILGSHDPPWWLLPPLNHLHKPKITFHWFVRFSDVIFSLRRQLPIPSFQLLNICVTKKGMFCIQSPVTMSLTSWSKLVTICTICCNTSSTCYPRSVWMCFKKCLQHAMYISSFFFFLYGAPAHIGPWPPLMRLRNLTLTDNR